MPLKNELFPHCFLSHPANLFIYKNIFFSSTNAFSLYPCPSFCPYLGGENSKIIWQGRELGYGDGTAAMLTPLHEYKVNGVADYRQASLPHHGTAQVPGVNGVVTYRTAPASLLTQSKKVEYARPVPHKKQKNKKGEKTHI